MTYPNQNTIIVYKKNSGGVFIMLDWEDLAMAARDLTPVGFKLYLYLAKNQDNYQLNFSSKDFCKTLDVSDRSFRDAKKLLIQKGYLQELENNKINFCTRPVYLNKKEDLKNRIIQIGEELMVKSSDLGNKYMEYIKGLQLKGCTDDTIYTEKASEAIKVGEKYLMLVAESTFNSLV